MCEAVEAVTDGGELVLDVVTLVWGRVASAGEHVVEVARDRAQVLDDRPGSVGLMVVVIVGLLEVGRGRISARTRG
ncbi:MAG: hypothetical protein WKF96_23470 [Solirubrobacteraceae bacterium]